MTISEWTHQTTAELKSAGIASARLDAEIILAHTLKKQRTYLHAHGEETLSRRTLDIADARAALRSDRTPVAYIIGHKEFYGRLFKVTPATLIPRPESEMIITLLKELLPSSHSLLHKTPRRLVDVGTGSGCLGITAKLELPELDVTLLDISTHALNVAEKNVRLLKADIDLVRSNMLADYSLAPDVILANLPYVDPAWERSPETEFEPKEALFAHDSGLHLIKNLLEEASIRTSSGCLIFLEADPRQHDEMIKYAKNHGFLLRESRDFIVVLEKL
jgi:release factor glutamine methyltransferase